MSFELYGEETAARINTLRPTDKAEAGLFEGTGRMVMQGFAKTGRALSLAAAPLAMAFEKSPNSTELQDSYFKKREEVFQGAVDHWTPKPNEIGAAAEVVGPLLSMIPQVFASPALAIASTQLSTAEDLVRKEVDTTKAQQVGAVQAAGLALGIWVPIFGRTLAERVLAGGVGFNVAQGAAMRAASGELLEGTPAAGDFKTLDATALTLDVLLGAAFGGLAHIHPGMRAEGEAWQKRISDMVSRLKPSEVDALVALKAGEHLNVDSMPGKPVDLVDTDAHVQRIRQAIDDLANDRPVNVEDMPPPKFEPDAARAQEAERVIEEWRGEAEMERAAQAADVAEAAAIRATSEAPDAAPSMADPIYRQSIEAMANETGWAETGGRVIRDPQTGQVSGRTSRVPNAEWWPGRPKGLSEAKAKQAIAKALAGEPLKPAEQRLIDYMMEYSRERVVPALRRLEGLDEAERARMANDLAAEGLSGHVRDLADYELIRQASEIDDGALEKAAVMYQNDDVAFMREAERIVSEHTSRQANQGAAPDGGGEARQAAAGAARPEDAAQAAGLDPLATAAHRFAADNPDLLINLGKHADGSDVVSTAREYLEAADDIVRQANDDARLFDAAAGCLLGGGR